MKTPVSTGVFHFIKDMIRTAAGILIVAKKNHLPHENSCSKISFSAKFSLSFILWSRIPFLIKVLKP